MPHLVVVGSSAALAVPLIEHYLGQGWHVTGLQRDHESPRITHPGGRGYRNGHLEVRTGLNFAVRDDARTLGDVAPIDLLVTLTGSVANAKLDRLTTPDWQTVLDDTLTSAFHVLAAGLPRVVSGGAVVVVGSVLGRTGGIGCGNYAAAKAGLVGLVRAAANEWARHSVRVNLLELGYTNLGMGERLPQKIAEQVLETIPLRRWITSTEFVDAVAYLGRAAMTGGVFPVTAGL